MLVETLQARGLRPHLDYTYIAVSSDQAVKEAALLQAFHSGKIVIIDEFNSSPMLEILLNALLEGRDLQGNLAEKPGFLLWELKTQLQ